MSRGKRHRHGRQLLDADGPYQRDPAAAFRRAQETELARDDHGFPDRTVQQLWRDPAWHEYVFTGGTGTVLDQPELIDATDPDDGPFMRPLTDEEVRAWAPGGRPTRADWRAALDSDRLDFPGRGQGRCTVLYEDGEPARIAYWGVTAD